MIVPPKPNKECKNCGRHEKAYAAIKKERKVPEMNGTIYFSKLVLRSWCRKIELDKELQEIKVFSKPFVLQRHTIHILGEKHYGSKHKYNDWF